MKVLYRKSWVLLDEWSKLVLIFGEKHFFSEVVYVFKKRGKEVLVGVEQTLTV